MEFCSSCRNALEINSNNLFYCKICKKTYPVPNNSTMLFDKDLTGASNITPNVIKNAQGDPTAILEESFCEQCKKATIHSRVRFNNMCILVCRVCGHF